MIPIRSFIPILCIELEAKPDKKNYINIFMSTPLDAIDFRV